MVERNLLFKIQADEKAAVQSLGRLAKTATREMGKVEDSLDDTRTAGQRVADGLKAVADDIERELGGAARAAEAMGEAIGPELKAKLGKGGLDGLVRDLRNAGLEFDDIERDAKDLGEAVKRLDRASAKVDLEADADDAKDDIDKVGDELRALDGDVAEVKIEAKGAEGFADAIRGLPGPLGGITDVLGPGGTVVAGVGAIGAGLFAAAGYATDVAIQADTMSRLTGDSVEYASALQSVWKTSGADINDLNDVILQMNGVLADNPEYAAQLGVNLNDGKTIGERFVEVVDKIGDANLNAADKAKLMSAVFGEEGVRQVATLTSVIEGDLSDAVDGVAEQNLVNPEDVERAKDMKQEVAELQADFSAAASELGQSLLPLLTRAAELAQKITEGLPGGGANSPINPMGRANEIDDLIEKYGDVITATYDAEASQVAWNDQVLSGVATGQLWNGILKALHGDTSTLTSTLNLNKASSERLDEAQRILVEGGEKLAGQLRDQAEAAQAASDQFLTAADATLAAEAAQDDFIEAVGASNQLIKDGKRDTDEYTQAVDAVRDAMIDSAKAAQRQKEEFWKAQGVTITAKDKLDAFNDSLLDNAHYATPEAQEAIADYIIEANGVPSDKVTEIKAAIARGDFDTAKRLLDEASAARDAAIIADAKTADAENELNYTSRDRTANVYLNPITAGGLRVEGPRVEGGPVEANKTYLVGEEGPELFQPKGDGTIIPNGGGGSPMAAGAGLGSSGGGSGGGGTVNFNVTVNAGPFQPSAAVARDVQAALATMIRVQGGDAIKRMLGL